MLGLAFGAYGEASDGMEQLALEIVERRSQAEWRRMGARSDAEAKGFIAAQLRRRWGLCAVRERARMLLARLPQVGLLTSANGGSRSTG